MSRREERAVLAREAAAKDKKRLVMFAAGLMACVVILVALNWPGDDPEERAAPPRVDIQGTMSVPEIDPAVIAPVRDGSAAERVILEPEPFGQVAMMAQTLFDSHLTRLGEPAFPFADGENSSAELRGEPFRLRGRIVDAEAKERVPGKDPEYWCLLETDAGERFFYASLRVPNTLFGSENYALADGFFYKYYTQTVAGERVTAPLIVGRQLIASYPEAPAIDEVDTVLLAAVQDPPIGSDTPLDERGLWHLLNVSRTLRAEDGGIERVFADARELEDEIIEDLAQAPEVWRGIPFVLGGMVRGRPSTEPLGENPLRMRRMAAAFVRNNSSGVDTLLHLVAPEGFDFDDPAGAVQFHGWFLQLYAYEDREGNLRRSPVFVVTDIQGIEGRPPPWANDVLWGFIGLSVVLAGVMILMVRRDKRRTAEFEAGRRAKRREPREG